jgi:hypothetical protein
LEPEAVCEANEAASLSVMLEPLVARSDFLEVGGGDVEIESEVSAGLLHLRSTRRTSLVG